MKLFCLFLLITANAFAAKSQKIEGTIQVKGRNLTVKAELKVGGKIKLSNKTYDVLFMTEELVDAESAEGSLSLYYGAGLDHQILNRSKKQIKADFPLTNFNELDCVKGEAKAFVSYFKDGEQFGNCLK